MADSGLSEMVVESVRVHQLSSQHVVLLREVGGERLLPIWIGPWEANAIAMRLQDVTPDRPLTHDLFASTLDRPGAPLGRLAVGARGAGRFPARLHLRVNGRRIEVAARPSDAIPLAIRSGAAIFAAAAVLE